ncbi:MAG: hypothetical protein AB8B74_06670 [Crocinitomicaceae bacterium]
MTTAILKSIAYFDIFNHPLHINELNNLCQENNNTISSSLNTLIQDKTLFQYNDYYSLQTNVESLVNERESKTAAAQKYLTKLPRYAKIIKAFPYVKGIGVSGSLSKNVMHNDGDIDYFIITSPNRLWICRTFLIAFKKIVLFNSKKYFCVNYFVDTNNLEIRDKNMFTAIETSFLLPVFNHELIHEFKTKNNWSKTFINQFEHPMVSNDIRNRTGLKNIVQWMFKGQFGDKLDLYLMKFTYRKWQKKFKDFDMTKFELTMRTNRGVSKHHPRDFQNRVLKSYTEKLIELGINE